MTTPITIGNAQAFWGDTPDAPARLLAQYPPLDYLTLDYLAEVSLSIMALQRSRDPGLGYARDFVGVVKSLAPHWKAGGHVRIVCNAGGLNPEACARAVLAALAEAGLPEKKVALVTGDDVLDTLKADPGCDWFKNWEDQRPLGEVVSDLTTANAYIGAGCVRDALALGADIVLTGRVADPSLTLGICMHAFGWAEDDWARMAAGTVAGHVIECGTQCCGGISTDWLDLPDPENIGFPVLEVSEDGSFVVTKPAGTGGRVTEMTVKEQLLYEIGDPRNYLSPDCRVDFTTLRVEEIAPDRVRVSGASGGPPTPHYKVSATHQDGWWASGMLTIFGRDASAKARRCGEVLFARLREAGFEYARTHVELLGAGAVAPGVLPGPALMETVLRVGVADPRREAVRRFAQELAPLVTSGPQGTTGYAAGRPEPRPVFAYWPCLIEKSRVRIETRLLEAAATAGERAQ
jgi:hypothetical protein